jgi:hypothetical protein
MLNRGVVDALKVAFAAGKRASDGVWDSRLLEPAG